MEGTYKFKLTVNDNSHSSIDHIFVFVSSSENFSPTVSLNTSNLASSYYYGSSIELLATANDIDGAIEKVEFYDNNVLIAELFEEPYSYVMHNLSLGMHTIKVIAYDDDGLSSEPSSFEIEIIEAPSCTGGPSNGDYTYEFSDDLNNPTITFIPSAGHVGNPTCILYYSTGGTPPGYNVTPNVPFQINADEGEVIQFYYTYSFNGLERNTSADPHSYEIGSCYSGQLDIEVKNIPNDFSLKQNYPNPFNPSTRIQYSLPKDTYVSIDIYDLNGKIVKSLVKSFQRAGVKNIMWEGNNDFGQTLSAGMYILVFNSDEYYASKKMLLLK